MASVIVVEGYGGWEKKPTRSIACVTKGTPAPLKVGGTEPQGRGKSIDWRCVREPETETV